MKEFKTLKFLDLFQFIFERLGINYPIMRKILTMKLTMDGRRLPTVFNQQSKKKKNKTEENGFFKSLWMYALFGLMLIPFVISNQNYFFHMSIFFGIVMFLVMTSMISDFSNVLLDVRDRVILQTKPVEKRTISAAKTIHICIYLFFLTISITGVPIIIGTLRHGVLFLILTLLALILIDLFIVVLTAVFYYFILQFFDGEKLKDMINYVQIGLSISMAIGYQILVRTMNFMNMKIDFSPSWWHFFLPPIWFGAPYELVLRPRYNGYLITFSLLALIIPIVAIMIYTKMMSSFEQNLAKLANNDGKRKHVHHPWKNGLIPLLCRSNEEKAFFRFSQNMMKNEREFRLKVYPGLGFSLVFPFIFMFNEIQMNSYHHLVTSKWYLAIYMSNIMIPTAVSMLRYSGKYKGAWIYKTVPLKSLAPLYSAALKVFIVNLYLPIYLILSVIFIVIFGFKIVPDLLVVFVTGVLITVIWSLYLKGTLPFSESFQDVKPPEASKAILTMLLIGVFIGIHFAITFIPYGVIIYFILLLLVTIFSWKQASKKAWTL
jgi:ABC-2 type transport system permease protein